MSPSPGSWLALVLLFVLLVPSVCLLWFVNRAAENERLAVRGKLVEAYRAHLVVAVERARAQWTDYAATLPQPLDEAAAAALLAREVRAGRADAVVSFADDGRLLYPRDRVALSRSEASDAAWDAAAALESEDPVRAAEAYARLAAAAGDPARAARALQAQARCLVRADDSGGLAGLVEGALGAERLRNATDAQGRLLVPNVELLALEYWWQADGAASPAATAVLRRLQARLDDYEGAPMPPAQRRFLMRELRRMFPQATFSTATAEDLARNWVEQGGSARREAGALVAGTLPGIWEFAGAGGRVVTLHRAEELVRRLRAAVSHRGLPADARVEVAAPGREIQGALVSAAIGDPMPGWRLGLSLQDRSLFDAAASDRVSFYGWIGALVVASAAVLAGLGVGLVRRQNALTQLRNDLVANVSHELKTPLASMRLLVDTLLASPRIEERTARDYLQLIAAENLRLSRLIENFLTFSRIERNRYKFAFEEVAPAAVAERAAAAVRERFDTPGCRFTVEIAADLPPIQADADALVTALVNLLDNAWKYSGATKAIALGAQAADGRVRFSVSDHGVGLSPADTRRIFRRFHQVRRTPPAGGGGFGLGLSIVHFIVTAHRGAIDVRSEPGRGSTFTVSLPALPPAAVTSHPHESAQHSGH